MKKYMLLLVVIGLLAAACSAQDPAASLLGAWQLSAFGAADAPTPAVEVSEAQITFNEDGTVTGNSGCNEFGGSYTVEGDQITFSEIVSTLVACEDPRMIQEQAVYQVLTETATFEIDGNTLTLTNNDMVLVLTR